MYARCNITLWLSLFGFAALSTPANCSAQAQWEFGLGLATLYLPDYRGAEQAQGYLLPIPYIRYQGDRFNVDEDGIRGKLFATDRAELDLSLAAGLPVNDEKNTARSGMPDLDPTLEFGPALHAKLGSSEDDHRRLWLKLPLRTVISVNTSAIDQQGWVFAPYLEYEIEKRENRMRRSELSISVGPLYADDRYHQYYYGVAPEFGTADRAPYEAGGGYSGSRITLTWTRRHDKWWIGAFMRYDNLSGATFEDSPLVKDRNYLAVGIALARILSQSQNNSSDPGRP